MTLKNLFKGSLAKNSKNNLKNNLSTYALVFVLVVVMAGLGQVLIRNIQGDKASANVNGNYLSQIGITSVDAVSGAAFTDSKKICQSIDGVCQADGIIDYDFSSLADRSNIAMANGGGIILGKNGDVFAQNGNLTSKNYTPNEKFSVTLTKIQVGIGLKPETLISLGYSVDGGSNFETAIGNFTNDQLKAQANQNVIEYILPTSTKINQGFSYRIALKADSKAQASPSLKYVRVFYDVKSLDVTQPLDDKNSGLYLKPGTATVTGQIGGALNNITGLDTNLAGSAVLSLSNDSKVNGKLVSPGTFIPDSGQIIPISTPVSGSSTLTADGGFSTTITTNLTAAKTVDATCMIKVGSATVTGQIGGALNTISGLEATCDADGVLTLPGGAKITGKVAKSGTFTPNPNQIIPATTSTTGSATLASFADISITTNLTPAAITGNDNSNAGNFLPIPSGGGDEKPAGSK